MSSSASPLCTCIFAGTCQQSLSACHPCLDFGACNSSLYHSAEGPLLFPTSGGCSFFLGVRSVISLILPGSHPLKPGRSAPVRLAPNKEAVTYQKTPYSHRGKAWSKKPCIFCPIKINDYGFLTQFSVFDRKRNNFLLILNYRIIPQNN